MYRLLILPAILLMLVLPLGAVSDPCYVTHIEIKGNKSDPVTSTVNYAVTVASKTECEKKHGKPRCNDGRKPAIYEELDTGKNSTLTELRELQYDGAVCYKRFKVIGIKCGDIYSIAVPFRGLIIDVVVDSLHEWTTTSLKLTIKPDTLVESFQVSVRKDDGAEIGNSGVHKRFENVVIPGDYVPGTCYVLRIKPTLAKRIPFCEYIPDREMPRCFNATSASSPPHTNNVLIALGTLLGILAVVALVAYFMMIRNRRLKREDEHLSTSLVPNTECKRTLWIVHTQESETLGLEVKNLINTLQEANVNQVYDISTIRDPKILSNAQPWLIDKLECQNQNSFILVLTAGLCNLLKAIRSGKTHNEALSGVLQRINLPTDFMLLTFLRYLDDSPSLKDDHKRLLVVRFEKLEHIEKQWEEDATGLGLSRVYHLPLHHEELQKALSAGPK